uniref:Triple QxxK/R motif-containing protein n=2 Tax=Salvator merianae TaxID=96440 RepID=A0A8D0BUH9_SALMN
SRKSNFLLSTDTYSLAYAHLSFCNNAQLATPGLFYILCFAFCPLTSFIAKTTTTRLRSYFLLLLRVVLLEGRGGEGVSLNPRDPTPLGVTREEGRFPEQRKMGKKDASSARIPVDQYRKQIGKQDYKKTRPMLKATRLKAEAKKTAAGIKEVSLVLAAILVFLLACYAFFYLNLSEEVDLDLDRDEN